MIYESIDQRVGNTPLLRLGNLEKKRELSARLLVKLEGKNPAGSVKDRVAKQMLDEAVESGKLCPGATVIEPTSGNTGIGLSALAAARGYKTVIVMPDSMSKERQMLMTAYGAQLVLTPGAKGMAGAIEKAKELEKETQNSFIAGQFENPANPKAHFDTTGPEIFRDTDGKVDIFVAGVGTGGTITGVGKFLKSKNPNIRVVAVEPADSPVLSGGTAGAHPLQGIGAGFIPDVLDADVIDEIITVTGDEAFEAARQLAKTEGVLAGISSGAALHAALLVASRPENKGKTVVTLLPDLGDRYLSTALFAE
jgi:cysteine synthase A